ncbi:MAG TPA: class III extradiol ring-cleavage dioxygenase [Planctomycetota bacterium]|nr:class III extradiol ring-cleavage dioxygenase [Planctomycetota bacterium]
MSNPSRLPAVLISHGSPMVAVEKDDYTQALRRTGESLPRPTTLVVVSAHWESAAPVRVGTSARPSLIYDFGGFPPELYDLKYPAPGNPGTAKDIVRRLVAAGIPAVEDPQRGLDHGAWVPLLQAYPDADVPVVEVTLPVPRTPAELLAIGKALAPLRDEGVLLVGSGGIVHNLRRVVFSDKNAPIESWARSFDDWIRARLEEKDVDAIVNYRSQAPEAAASVPTTEHFDPLFVVLGAVGPDFKIRDLYEGFHYGNLSLRTFAVGEFAAQKRRH